jgi:hypothetical protein
MSPTRPSTRARARSTGNAVDEDCSGVADRLQSTVQARCQGHGCPFARRRLPAKTTLQVRIAREDSIGQLVEFTFRRGSLPASRTLCTRPGDDSLRRRC